MNKGIGMLAVMFLAAVTLVSAEVPLNQREARVSPAWMTDGVMYQLWLRGFTPEGTLRAAARKLPQVAEAGFTILYLSPICVMDDDPRKEHWAPRQRKTDNPRNPYRIKDYWEVDPEFGTKEDLRAFVKEAHRLGMRVLLDVVFLHCGPGAVIIRKHPDFMKRDAAGNLKLAGWGFPGIDFGNPRVHDYFWRNLEYWVREFDVDGYRCDVADAIPLAFWETARERLEKIKSDIGVLAEGTRKENQLKAFDLNYGWGPAYKNWEDAAAIRALWEKQRDERPRNGAKFVRFIENHDYVEDEGDNRLDRAWGVARVDAVLTALFTLDGVPFLYNGQEFADVSRNSLYAKWPIDWSAAATPAGRARLALVRKLCALRKAEKALTKGEVVWLDHDAPKAVLAFQRVCGTERILSVVNLSGAAARVSLKGVDTAFEPLLVKGAEGDMRGHVVLEANGYAVSRSSPTPRP
ncbi:MAG: alpha-amylase family glycosyl hydrolase [Kiritimatiellia bacterium]|jgi:glycosidase|nr:alpha-amylase family glycosyl hydrolase [Kiritimatiellia bacterium]